MNKKKKPVEKWEKRAKKDLFKELSKKPYSIDLNVENVLALGKKIMKTIEEYIEDRPDTINAEIHYALFQVAVFVYGEGIETLPNPPETAYIDEKEEGECLCEDCKRKKELEKITKEHEALVENYIQ